MENIYPTWTTFILIYILCLAGATIQATCTQVARDDDTGRANKMFIIVTKSNSYAVEYTRI